MDMKRGGLALLLFALVLAQPARAWNNTGHEAVAGIAWDNMTPAARQAAIELLQKAPADACLLELFSNDGRPLADRQREFFMRAATWPDAVRPRDNNDHRPCTRFHQRSWHFIDHFWKGVSGATGSDAPQDVTTIPTPATNAVERLKTFRGVVPCDAPSCGTPDERATELAWMLHLAGDIHQPLHTASRVTALDPQGDAGGNAFKLGNDPESPLHTYWDHIVDTEIPRNPGESGAHTIDYINRVIARLVNDHPRASLAAEIHPGDFDAWAADGFAAAKSTAYPASLVRDQRPDTAYRDMAFQVADRAIALGGYRLADLMNQMFGAGGPAAHLPTPDHIVIVIEENKGFADVIGSSKAPYINELAGRGASLTAFHAAHHPSQPNYVEFFAGSTLGVCKDECPIGPFDAPNLGAALLDAGKGFAGFAENLPASGARTTCHNLRFAPKHCPWVDFSSVPASASRSFSRFPSDPAGFAALPAVSFVIPNLNHDMHNGLTIGAEVKSGDAWLKANLSAYADWAETHNSLLIVTWDEDSSDYTTHCPQSPITTQPPANRIATILVGEPVRAGSTSATPYTHLDLLRTILDIYGIAPFGGAQTAKAIDDVWR